MLCQFFFKINVYYFTIVTSDFKTFDTHWFSDVYLQVLDPTELVFDALVWDEDVIVQYWVGTEEHVVDRLEMFNKLLLGHFFGVGLLFFELEGWQEWYLLGLGLGLGIFFADFALKS